MEGSSPGILFGGDAWGVFTKHQAGYFEIPTDGPKSLYQDVFVSVGFNGSLNKGRTES
jgi:hypothetical protein